MASAKGSKSGIVWKEQSASLTIPSNTGWKGMSFESETLDEQINKVTSSEIRSDRTVPGIRGGNIGAGGDIVTEFDISRFGVWFKHLMAANASPGSVTNTNPAVPALASGSYLRGQYVYAGSAPRRIYLVTVPGSCSGGDITAKAAALAADQSVTVGTVGLDFLVADASPYNNDLYKHAFIPGIDMPTSGLCLEKQIKGGGSDLFIAFLDCRLNSLNLQIPQEGMVKSTWNILATKTVAGSSTNAQASPAITSSDPCTGLESYVTWGNQAAINRPISTANITITNNFAADVYAIGSRFRREVPEGRRECSGQFAAYFEDLTEYTKFKDEITSQLDFSFHRNGRFALLSFKEVKITGNGTPKVSGAGIVTASFDFSAFKSVAPSDMTLDIYDLNAAPI